jgi:hypothetical protein
MTAVMVANKEEFIDLTQFLENEKNKYWGGRADYDEAFSHYHGDPLCVNVDDTFLHYCNRKWYIDQDYEVISLTEYFAREGKKYKTFDITLRRIRLRKTYA